MGQACQRVQRCCLKRGDVEELQQARTQRAQVDQIIDVPESVQPREVVPQLVGAESRGGRTNSSANFRWVDPFACSALCQLILDSRKAFGITLSSPRLGNSNSLVSRRIVLPPCLYVEHVAPYLRLDISSPNMLYAFGGRDEDGDPLDTVEMFDSWHGRWVPCARMPTRRASTAAALLPDNRIIVIGGYNERGSTEGLLNTCDLYDPFTRSWDLIGAAPLARKRWGHSCASFGGKVYVVGGCSLQPGAMPRVAYMETLRCCEVFSPMENKWSPCASLQIARGGSRAVALDERYLVAIGGCSDVFGTSEVQQTVELFDPLTGCWSLLDALRHPRTAFAVAPLDSRRLLVVGGSSRLKPLGHSSAEVYTVRLPGEGGTPAGDGSSLEARDVFILPGGRTGCQAVVLNLPAPGSEFPCATRPCAVVVGGEAEDVFVEGDTWLVKDIDVFDVIEGKWRKYIERYMPPIPTARAALALCVGVGHVSRAEALQSSDAPARLLHADVATHELHGS